MSDLSPELQAELVEFVRETASNQDNWVEVFDASHKRHRRAKTLAAKLPEPPDPDIEEARKVVDASPIAPWDRWAKPSHNLFLSLLKCGRELERSAK